MLRKAAFLSIAWYVIAVTLSGCCNCPEPSHFRFRWTTLDISVHPYSQDSGFIRISPDSTTDFTSRNPVLRTLLDFELITKNSTCPGIMNQAYACKCFEDQYTPEKNMVDLRVYTLDAYDSTHPAMSDITDCFGELHYSPDSSYLQPLSPFRSSSSYGGAAVMHTLYLNKRPASAGDYQFRVTYFLSDSSTISAVTPALRF